MKAQLEILQNRSTTVPRPEDDASHGPSHGQSEDMPADAIDPLTELAGEDIQQGPNDEDMLAGSLSIVSDNLLPAPTAASPAKQSRKDPAERWQELLPTLVEPLLAFRDRTVGKDLDGFDSPGPCATSACIVLETDIQVIEFDWISPLQSNGRFLPTLCTLPALIDYSQGEALQDPIHRGLGHSLQWYDALVVAIDRHITEKIDALKQALPKLPNTISPLPSPLSRSKAFKIASSAKAASNPSSTTAVFSTTPASSTTANVATSSTTSSTTPSATSSATSSAAPSATSGVNSSSTAPTPPSTSQPSSTPHSLSTTTTTNNSTSPKSPPLQLGACHPYLQRLCPACFGGSEFGQSFQHSVRFLSKEFVKSVGERLTDARGRPPKPREVVVPDDVVDSDRDAYKAAKGDSKKKPNDIFDENGLMALVCQHDIPIFVTSIDTPGEQQKDAVALLEALFLMLLLMATVAGLYDIACVLNRSVRMRAVRLWMLDRQCDAIARDIWEDLGRWLRCKIHRNVQKKEVDAVRTLRQLSVSVNELCNHWAAQREAQSSSRSLAPACLKKELAKVFQLQTQIDALEEEIAEAKAAVRMMGFPPATFILRNLEEAHRKLKSEAEALYSSLNINDEYPELQNLPLKYLHKLILARDLKITIRKKAIGSFFEWDKLDMAVGGMHEAMGTKAHQVTREAIARQKSAFENLIQKFNQYVTKLEGEHQPWYCVPVPKKLPMQLVTLRDMETSHLWEDVWICERTVPPKWLTNEDVRKGIQAVLMLDHCAEERVCLQTEVENLCHWFRDELQALRYMAQDQRYAKYRTIIKLWLNDHLLLVNIWSNLFFPASVFRDQVRLVEQWLTSPPNHEAPTPSPLQKPRSEALSIPMSVDTASSSASSAQVRANTPPPTTHHSTDPSSGTAHGAALDQGSSLLDDQVPDTGDDAEEDDNEVEIVSERIALQDVIDKDPSLDDAEDVLHLVWEIPYSFNRPSKPEMSNVLFSPHVIPQLLRNTDSSVNAAWKYNCRLEYWRKPVWILPIHDKTAHHWALAVIRVDIKEIHIFDSFEQHSSLSEWVPEVQQVVSQLTTLAKDQGLPVLSSLAVLSSWIAKPLQIGHLQNNTHDCGVWVLWVIMSLVCGYDFTPLTEECIAKFRKFLARLIRTIPV
ncbi:hypothetical protein AAF712_011947 [Marasmius tenuissimus]|uniref:Ubiquitin-like protease family profile domain-containing protein n=1 Tax=Marasmius tenuissimus TaxID=585030 RepID=A0ABR2ZI41_9AGAR